LIVSDGGPRERRLSRTETDKLEEIAKAWAQGLRAAKSTARHWTQAPLAKSVTPEARAAINAATGRSPET